MPHCPKCTSTYDALDDKGIKYKVVDLKTDAKAFKFVTEELGYLGAPVVVTDVDHWSGYRADKIEELAQRLAK